MYRIAIAAFLLAFAASGNAEAAEGLRLNISVPKLTSKLPILNNLVTSKGPTLPLLGDLPGLNLRLGQRVVLLGNVNVADILDAVDVGRSASNYAGVLVNQIRREK